MISAFLVVICGGLTTFDSGSDGSDGAFSPQFSVVIDLADAATASWDTQSPIAGNGVYDPQKWAVVFKYTTIDIPPKVIVTFKNHPSGAPVIWLASGEVNISGSVILDGNDASSISSPPAYAAPGPGGFSGGVRPTGSGTASGGFGPGGGGTSSAGGFQSGPVTYGTANLVPLVGGSGGGGATGNGGGGGGGGAILIASSDSISLSASGAITANGGDGFGYGGSGGGIRLIANIVQGLGQLRAVGGLGIAAGGVGYIRVDADIVTLSDLGSPNWTTDFSPMPVFPAANAPTIEVTTIAGQPVPADPAATIYTTETILNTGLPVTVGIEARNVPASTTVSVRVVPARGSPFTVVSTPLVQQGGGVLTASATVTFPSGKSEMKLRANWAP